MANRAGTNGAATVLNYLFSAPVLVLRLVYATFPLTHTHTHKITHICRYVLCCISTAKITLSSIIYYQILLRQLIYKHTHTHMHNGNTFYPLSRCASHVSVLILLSDWFPVIAFAISCIRLSFLPIT